MTLPGALSCQPAERPGPSEGAPIVAGALLREPDALAADIGLVGGQCPLNPCVQPSARSAKVDDAAHLGADLDPFGQGDQHLQLPRLPVQPIRREADDPLHLPASTARAGVGIPCGACWQYTEALTPLSHVLHRPESRPRRAPLAAGPELILDANAVPPVVADPGVDRGGHTRQI